VTGKITAQSIERVLAFLHLLEGQDAVLYEVQTDPLTIDPYRYSDEVGRFVKTLYSEGFIVPFDWPAWQEEAKQYLDNPTLLDEADLSTVQKLLTTHVRKDRFVGGHLAAMLDNGHIHAILKRLEALCAELDRAV
jgi:hypothetical protein